MVDEVQTVCHNARYVPLTKPETRLIYTGDDHCREAVSAAFDKSQRIDNRRPRAAAWPELAHPGLIGGLRKRRLAAAASAQEIVNQIGYLFHYLRLGLTTALLNPSGKPA